MENYIGNIGHQYKCKLKLAPFKSAFEPTNMRQHLMNMIPGLKLPKTFELSRKPDYLRKSSYRTSPKYVPKPMSDEQLIRMNKCKDVQIILPRCEQIPEYIRFLSNDDNEPFEKRARFQIRSRSNSLEFETRSSLIDSSSEDDRNDDSSVVSITRVPCTSDEDEEIMSSYSKPDDNHQMNILNGNRFIRSRSVDFKRIRETVLPNTCDETLVLNTTTTSNYHAVVGEGLSNPIGVFVADSLRQTVRQFIKSNEVLRQSVDDLIIKLKVKTETENNLESEVTRLESVINEKDQTLKGKDEELSRLKSTIDILNDRFEKGKATMSAVIKDLEKKLKQKNAQRIRLKEEHYVEILKVIEYTKAKKWCVARNCKNEAADTQSNQPVCSANCLINVW